MTKNYISPLSYHNSIENLSDIIYKDKFVPDIILGVSRGGLIPAVYLSHYLGNILLRAIYVSTKDRDEFIIPQDLINKLDNSEVAKILIVEDLVDSGHTISLLKFYFSKYNNLDIRYATVYAKEDSCKLVNYYQEIVDDRWIVFPYEKD